jgi:hypothetical protein
MLETFHDRRREVWVCRGGVATTSPAAPFFSQERNRRNVVFDGTDKSFISGAGDGTRTRDVQLGKTTVNWKQRTLRFLVSRSGD